MRIVHVTATFPPYRGGTGNVCFYNARELARRGHSVTVVTAAVPGAPGEDVIDGIHIRRLAPLTQLGNAPVLPGLMRALRGFDLIHLHYPFILGAELTRLGAALAGIPLVVSFHNDLIASGVRSVLFPAYQRLSIDLVVRGAARLCVVSIDHYRSSALGRVLGDWSGVVELPNGVDTQRFCPAGPTLDLSTGYGIPKHARVVLFVAALDRAHHFKGLERLLQALTRLPADVWLLVVGDGDLRPAFVRTARRLELLDRVVFAGAIDHDDLPPFYRSARLTVLPSSPPESFGLVLVESMACGTPVVASRIPGVRAVVDHGLGGLLVDAADPTALARAIDQVLSNDTMRQAMGRCGRAIVEARYAWERVGERLEAIYADVLRSPKLRPSIARWLP